MRLLHHILLSAILLASCIKETDLVPESPVGYTSVGIDLDKGPCSGTKSTVSADVENLSRAVLFAFDPRSGDILIYGSNAGNLAGQPIVKRTEDRLFTWALPLDTPIDIFAVVNYPDDFDFSSHGASLTKDYLLEQSFRCGSVSQLQALESSGYGLPMSGIKEGVLVSDDNATVSVQVKNLFAKYRIRLSRENLPDDASISVSSLEVLRANTEVPYFSENFKQTSPGKLVSFDYATPAQLQDLSEGGQAYVYALENCHGTTLGASSWNSVYDDLNSSWEELSQCTLLLLEYSINMPGTGPVPYCRRIYLGEGDMCTDFNLRRNLLKDITIALSDRVFSPDPYFKFNGSAALKANPGSSVTLSYTSNLGSFGLTPSFCFFDMDGNPSSNVSCTAHSPYVGTATFKFSVNCEDSEVYVIQGGASSAVYSAELDRSISAFDRRTVGIEEKLDLTFIDESIFQALPYVPKAFISRERFSLSKAREIAGTMSYFNSSSNIDPSLSGFSIRKIGEEYAICADVMPVLPGPASFRISYKGSRTTPLLGFNVSRPTLGCEGPVHVGVDGSSSSFRWLVKDSDGNPADSIYRGCEFELHADDPYGTDISLRITDSSLGCSACLKGFTGLPGFQEENYSFNGLTFNASARITYPNGYSVSGQAAIIIDNPVGGLGINGDISNFKVLQGQSAQESYVSVSPGQYHVEYMMDWPGRTFCVDLTRGGTRLCDDNLEMWTLFSNITDLDDEFSLSGGRLSFAENLSNWGPLYLGKQISNSWSGEQVKLVHSIVRLYSRFNVFACYNAREMASAKVDWSNIAAFQWKSSIFAYGDVGCLPAAWKSNFSMGGYLEDILTGLVTKDLRADRPTAPVLNGFSTDYSAYTAVPKIYSNQSQYIRSYIHPYGNPSTEYYIGWYDYPDDSIYCIFYSSCLVGMGFNVINFNILNWRCVAASNTPWFKLKGGDMQTDSGYYVTRINRMADGSYNFNVLPDNRKQNLYLDNEGKGYLSIRLFWEGKEGRFMVPANHLYPFTQYGSTGLCLVNGWYDPSVYRNGLPLLAEHTGMYFYPEGISSNTRSGYPAYYYNDNPYINDTFSLSNPEQGSPLNSYYTDTMELGLNYGDIEQRDINASKY